MHVLRPTFDRLLVEPIEIEEGKSSGGIYIPDVAKNKPQVGRVVGVGPGARTPTGETIPMQHRVGDLVVFGRHNGYTVRFGVHTLLVLREDEVFAEAREVAEGEDVEGLITGALDSIDGGNHVSISAPDVAAEDSRIALEDRLDEVAPEAQAAVAELLGGTQADGYREDPEPDEGLDDEAPIL